MFADSVFIDYYIMRAKHFEAADENIEKWFWGFIFFFSSN